MRNTLAVLHHLTGLTAAAPDFTGLLQGQLDDIGAGRVIPQQPEQSDNAGAPVSESDVAPPLCYYKVLARLHYPTTDDVCVKLCSLLDQSESIRFCA